MTGRNRTGAAETLEAAWGFLLPPWRGVVDPSRPRCRRHSSSYSSAPPLPPRWRNLLVRSPTQRLGRRRTRATQISRVDYGAGSVGRLWLPRRTVRSVASRRPATSSYTRVIRWRKGRSITFGVRSTSTACTRGDATVDGSPGSFIYAYLDKKLGNC